ncbi:uncharacterized protein DDB_G0290685 [Nematostella vectensis]|uniref:uncharacterized protein DDB_G0290685 n=1 Tax=Nematostella vectensis TaxID=45351 RepID=UPI0020771FE6|nr:uncharacterized protein DDB_G0290685 [Nematostella vectensis]
MTLSPSGLNLALAVVNSTLNATVSPAAVEVNYVVGVVVELVILLLVVGNLLMVITLLLYKPSSTTDILLCSLSAADLINGLIPLQVLNIYNSFIGRDQWTLGVCGLLIWMTYTLRFASVLTITLISAERTLMLARPLQHHTIVTPGKARVAVGATWTVSAFLSALPFMGAGKNGFSAGFCYYQLYDLGLAYGVVVETIGFAQLVLVLLCFIAIKISSWKFTRRQECMAAVNMTGKSQSDATSGTKQVKQLATMMAIVVVLYYLSWLPYLLMNLVSLAQGRLSHSLEIIIGMLSLVSALINPLLYGKMSLRYRKGFLFIFKKIAVICGGKQPDGSFFDGARRGSVAIPSSYSLAAKRGSYASVLDGVSSQHANAGYDDDEVSHQALNTTSTTLVLPTDKDADPKKHDKGEEEIMDEDDAHGIAIYPLESLEKESEIPDGGDDDIMIYPISEHDQESGIKESSIKSQQFNEGNTDGAPIVNELQPEARPLSSLQSSETEKAVSALVDPDSYRNMWIEEVKETDTESMEDGFSDGGISNGYNIISNTESKFTELSRNSPEVSRDEKERNVQNDSDDASESLNESAFGDDHTSRILDELFSGLEDDTDADTINGGDGKESTGSQDDHDASWKKLQCSHPRTNGEDDDDRNDDNVNVASEEESLEGDDDDDNDEDDNSDDTSIVNILNKREDDHNTINRNQNGKPLSDYDNRDAGRNSSKSSHIEDEDNHGGTNPFTVREKDNVMGEAYRDSSAMKTAGKNNDIHDDDDDGDDNGEDDDDGDNNNDDNDGGDDDNDYDSNETMAFKIDRKGWNNNGDDNENNTNTTGECDDVHIKNTDGKKDDDSQRVGENSLAMDTFADDFNDDDDDDVGDRNDVSSGTSNRSEGSSKKGKDLHASKEVKKGVSKEDTKDNNMNMIRSRALSTTSLEVHMGII